MPNKKTTIEQLKEGFLITDEAGEQYAKEHLIPWLEKFFDIPHEEVKESKKKSS